MATITFPSKKRADEFIKAELNRGLGNLPRGYHNYTVQAIIQDSCSNPQRGQWHLSAEGFVSSAQENMRPRAVAALKRQKREQTRAAVLAHRQRMLVGTQLPLF